MRYALLLLLAAAALETPATAAWKTVPANVRTPIAQGAMTVLAPDGWNLWTKRPIKKGERWSFDGPTLNRIDFFAGLGPGEPLAKEIDRKREPLPKLMAGMKATDIAEMYEQTLRSRQGVADFAIEQIEPAPFGGQRGFRFTFRYSDGELGRKGEARGALVGDRLFMMVLDAPELHFFDRDVRGFRQIADSAAIGPVPTSTR